MPAPSIHMYVCHYNAAIESLLQSNSSIMKPVLKMKSHKLILFFQVTFETTYVRGII